MYVKMAASQCNLPWEVESIFPFAWTISWWTAIVSAKFLEWSLTMPRQSRHKIANNELSGSDFSNEAIFTDSWLRNPLLAITTIAISSFEIATHEWVHWTFKAIKCPHDDWIENHSSNPIVWNTEPGISSNFYWIHCEIPSSHNCDIFQCGVSDELK